MSSNNTNIKVNTPVKVNGSNKGPGGNKSLFGIIMIGLAVILIIFFIYSAVTGFRNYKNILHI